MKKNSDEMRIVKNAEGELRIQKDTVLKYIGEAESVTIPKNVTRIAPYAFFGCKSLKTVVTPVKLSSIGKGAFYGCDNLKEVTIPGRLYLRVNGGKVFPTDADIYFRFYASSGDPLEDEDYSDIYNSEEEYLKAAESNYTVAFEPPASPAPVSDNVADNGFNMSFTDEIQDQRIITIEEDLPIEPEEETEDKDYFENETLQEKMDAIIPPDEDDDPTKHHELVNLSDYLIEEDRVIKYIGSAKETTVPKFITQIAENAFANTDVEVVHIPERLEVIGKNAFSWCQKLKFINIPDNVHLIDDGAFSNCSVIDNIQFPKSLKFIGASSFRACCALREIDLPESLTAISRRAFDFCISLERVEVPSGIKILSEGVFSHCDSLRKVILPEGLTSIGAWAFAECIELREINFPEGLETIEEVAFFNCKSMVAFDLPKSLKILGRQAFVGCQNLHLVNMPSRLAPQVKTSKAFHKVDKVQIHYFE